MPIAAVNGTEIWHEAQGSGHPLMLFPGLGMDHTYYRLGEPLLRAGRTTVLVDPRGVGRSRKDDPASVTYGAELWADDFAALAPGNLVAGPAVIHTPITTIVVQAAQTARMDPWRNIVIAFD